MFCGYKMTLSPKRDSHGLSQCGWFFHLKSTCSSFFICFEYIFTIPEFTKERYLSRVAKARALVPLREKFAHFLFSSYLFFYFIFHLLCYISVSHKVCSSQWCQKFYILYWEIKIGSQNGDFEWLCKCQLYPRAQNQWLSSQSGSWCLHHLASD